MSNTVFRMDDWRVRCWCRYITNNRRQFVWLHSLAIIMFRKKPAKLHLHEWKSSTDNKTLIDTTFKSFTTGTATNFLSNINWAAFLTVVSNGTDGIVALSVESIDPTVLWFSTAFELIFWYVDKKGGRKKFFKLWRSIMSVFRNKVHLLYRKQNEKWEWRSHMRNVNVHVSYLNGF